jgi:hypothetical protein
VSQDRSPAPAVAGKERAMHVVAVFDAKGGPPRTQLDRFKIPMHPTKPGRYQLQRREKHVSGRWDWSKIAWGTPIEPTPSNDVLFEKGGHKHSLRKLWHRPSTDNLVDEVKKRVKEVYQREVFPKTWVLNDFGPFAWQLIEVGNSKNNSHFMHTTPEDERDALLTGTTSLDYSHGCIHLDPKQRDYMAGAGYLRAGNLVIVHKQTERPAPIRIGPVKATRHYVLHFFPSVNKLYVTTH